MANCLLIFQSTGSILENAINITIQVKNNFHFEIIFLCTYDIPYRIEKEHIQFKEIYK